MVSLQTTYLGLTLKNPLMIGSSGLTSSVEKIIELEQQGASAVVLKSLFEEQILHEAHATLKQDELTNQYPEALDYIKNYSKENSLTKYLQLIRDAKTRTAIPIIASINCFSSSEWTTYASRIEQAGADAIELNVFVLPSDPMRSSESNEKTYFDILQAVLKEVRIPVSLKISYYFSGLAQITRKFDWSGARGLVLFNRFYSPDIDIEQMKVIPSHIISEPSEISIPLRWVALLSGELKCDLVGTTGIHDGAGIIKMLLAGATAVQVVSAIYQHGPAHIGVMLKQLEAWMEKNNFQSVKEFKGKLSFSKAENPAAYERVQFMKHFSGIE